MIREFGLKLSTLDNIFLTIDAENQTLNKALNFINNNSIPIRTCLAHISDDRPWNIAVSEFEYHSNQGLIGYKMLLKHVSRNLYYYAGRFHQHVEKLVVLNQEILQYFE